MGAFPDDQSQFMAGVSTLDLGGLMGMLGSESGDLQRVVAANQAGAPIDPSLHVRGGRQGSDHVKARFVHLAQKGEPDFDLAFGGHRHRGVFQHLGIRF